MSKAMKHTLGDWFVVERDTTFDVETKDGMHVVRTSWHHNMRKPYPLKAEALANARLIAAAPDLLEQLRNAEELLMQTLRWRGEGWECSESELLGDIRAAIAKATGGPNA